MSLDTDIAALLPKMKAYAFSILRNRDDAEDVASTAMVKALAGAAMWRANCNLEGWVLTIVKNAAIDLRNRRAYRAKAIATGPQPVVSTAPNQHAHLELAETLRALATVKEPFRDRLALIGLGFTYADIAKLQRCQIGTVLSGVSRARAQLQEALA